MASAAPVSSGGARKGRRGHRDRKTKSGGEVEAEDQEAAPEVSRENESEKKVGEPSDAKALTPRSLLKIMSLPTPSRSRTASPPTATAADSGAATTTAAEQRRQRSHTGAGVAGAIGAGGSTPSSAAGPEPWALSASPSEGFGLIPIPGGAGGSSAREQLRARGMQTLQRSWHSLNQQGVAPSVVAIGGPGGPGAGAGPVPLGLPLAPKMPPPTLPPTLPTALSLGGVSPAGNYGGAGFFHVPQGMMHGYPTQASAASTPMSGSHCQTPMSGFMSSMPSPVSSEACTPRYSQQPTPQPDLLAMCMPDPFYMNLDPDQIANHLRSVAADCGPYED